MSFETVDIYIKDTDADPIPSVVVRIYSEDGKTFYTQASTNGSGVVSFLLNTQRYQLRFFKLHVSLPNPTYIDVLTSPASNVFDVAGELVPPPTAINPRFCTAYGYFRRPDSLPAGNVDVHFIAKFKPLLLDGEAVVTERIVAKTDKTGYLQIDLIRNGQYSVTVQGIEDQQRLISIPDAGNISLPALLFPVVDRVTFDPAGPWTIVSGGNDLQLTATVYGSDGNTLEPFDVIWTSSNPTVLAVLTAGGTISLRGLTPGTAYLQGVRADQSIVRIPNTAIGGLPAVVTVT